MSTAYTAHVTTREGIAVRVENVIASNRIEAALTAMLRVGEKSRRASARPVIDQPLHTEDCCGMKSLASVADSAFGSL